MLDHLNIKKLVKLGFNQLGLDLVRRHNSPSMTLLGLRSRPIMTVIDVGANTGQFAKRVSRFFPEAVIYCFEPLPDPFNELCKWAKTQNERVLPFNLAIGSENCEVSMFLHEDHTPSSSVLATTKLTEQYYPVTKAKKKISVAQKKLDTVFEENQKAFSSEILIKLDVQGYEDRVIAGGVNTFSKADACILEVSLDTLYKDQAGFRELLTMLDELGYCYIGNMDQVYAEDGHCIFLDAVFQKILDPR